MMPSSGAGRIYVCFIVDKCPVSAAVFVARATHQDCPPRPPITVTAIIHNSSAFVIDY